MAVGLSPGDAGGAAGADWPPFVLVTGLLLLGLVAGEDGLFDAAGALVARVGGGGPGLLLAASAFVAVVTAVLNLDTAVVFGTPVLLVAARQRGTAEEPFLYLSVLLANNASLLLPGSNLTNLIVLGHEKVSGASFAFHMLAVWAVAVACVPVVLLVVYRRPLRRSSPPTAGSAPAVRRGVGLAGVLGAVVAMVALPPAAAAGLVLAIGVSVVAVRLIERRVERATLAAMVNVPVLLGLFGLAVALGTLGRGWAAPSSFLHHLSIPETAVFRGAASVVVNNLPAASLFAARSVPHPYALLVGLNLGPNLAVTGALSALLWLQVGRAGGGRPSAIGYSRLGLLVVPVSVAAALATLGIVH